MTVDDDYETLAGTYIEGACETVCTRWPHKPDPDVRGLRRCSWCLGAIISTDVADWKKLDGCTVDSNPPLFGHPNAEPVPAPALNEPEEVAA